MNPVSASPQVLSCRTASSSTGSCMEWEFRYHFSEPDVKLDPTTTTTGVGVGKSGGFLLLLCCNDVCGHLASVTFDVAKSPEVTLCGLTGLCKPSIK